VRVDNTLLPGQDPENEVKERSERERAEQERAEECAEKDEKELAEKESAEKDEKERAEKKRAENDEERIEKDKEKECTEKESADHAQQEGAHAERAEEQQVEQEQQKSRGDEDTESTKAFVEEDRPVVDDAKVEFAVKSKVQDFLLAEGFKSVSAPRRKCCRTTFALHRAVEENDVEIVRALLDSKADRSQKNSRGETPYKLAERLDRQGSHTLVLKALALEA